MDFATAYNLVTNTAQYNNAWSAEQAQKQMDFQREMSNTAHQREMADLKAAGLNPVLSAKLGGASTPSGAAASADTSLTSAVLQLASQAMEASTMSAAALAGGTGSAAAEDWIDLPNLFGSQVPEDMKARKPGESVGDWLDRQAALLNSTDKPQLFGRTADMLQQYKKDFPTRRRPIVDAVSNGLQILQKIVDNKKFTAKDVRNGLGSRYIYNYYRNKDSSAKGIRPDAVSR